jgi:hypothetical protein
MLNEDNLARLPGDEHVYDADDLAGNRENGYALTLEEASDYMNKNTRWPQSVSIKVGAAAMLVMVSRSPHSRLQLINRIAQTSVSPMDLAVCHLRVVADDRPCGRHVDASRSRSTWYRFDRHFAGPPGNQVPSGQVHAKRARSRRRTRDCLGPSTVVSRGKPQQDLAR